MAHLDTLIDRIGDSKLRSEIRHQVGKLAAKASFGLVFEEHRPETVTLPGFEVTRGSKVSFKDKSKPGVWVVTKVDGDTATLIHQDDRTERVTAALPELVVVREFGDPIYPGLESVASIERGGDRPFHSVINAENYHALEMLFYPYAGKLDVIYIDPPYNTGAKDWKYNNDYVDGEDTYRHSKWLSFMERRLKLAKELLNPADSVLIVTIDEKEYLRLGILLEQTFPESSIQMVSSVINPSGAIRKGKFSRQDEYLFFVFVGDAKAGTMSVQSDGSAYNAYWRTLRRRGGAATRKDRPNSFYPIFVNDDGTKILDIGASLPLETPRETVVAPAGQQILWPINGDGSEGRWQLGGSALKKALEQGFVRLRTVAGSVGISYLAAGEQKKVKDGAFPVQGKEPSGALILGASVEEKTASAGTVWDFDSHNAGEYGASLLRSLIPGRKFPYPKSLYAVEDALRFFVKDKPNARILDFFGGSGTTAHAVMRLNKQDGGMRQSITVTNNAVSDDEDKVLRDQGLEPGDDQYEALGIFEYITLPRIMAAVSGTTPDGAPVAGDYKFVDEFPMKDGLQENVEFFKLTYEDNHLVRLGRAFKAIAPILWLRAGAEGERIIDLPAEGWSVPKKSFYGLLTDIDQWEPFVNAVNARDDIRCVFIVTDSQAEFEAINLQISQGIDSVRLYSDYLQSFEINTRQG